MKIKKMTLFTSLKTNTMLLSKAKTALVFLLVLQAPAAIFAQNNKMAKLSVQLLLNLNGGPNNTADGLVAVFANNFSSGIGNEDSYKFTNMDENVAINRNGTNLSIEGRPTIAAYDTLPLKMWQFRHKNYFFKIDAANFSPSLTAVIKDAFLKTETAVDLTGSTTVPLNITSDPASAAANRFTILFRPVRSLIGVVKSARASTKGQGVQVEWVLDAKTIVSAVMIEKSSNGKTFTHSFSLTTGADKRAVTAGNWLDENAGAADNYYRVKTISVAGETSYSETMKVAAVNKADLSVYPNPATGSRINVRLNGLDKGTYAMSIYNSNGQVVFTTQVKHAGGTSVQAIVPGVKIPAGIYTLQVTNGLVMKSQMAIFQ